MNLAVRRGLALLLYPAVLFWGCKSQPKRKAMTWEEPLGDPVISAVTFDFKTLETSGTWLCTYSQGGRVAKFRLHLSTPTCSKPEGEDFQMCSGQGKFIAETGSDSTVLLHDLQISLEAKSAPTNVKRVSELPFEYVRFGEKLSRTAKGGLADAPSGTWTAMKLFIGQGEDEGEVFFNINPDTGHGEFSIKDAEYGDIVLAQLATVL